MLLQLNFKGRASGVKRRPERLHYEGVLGGVLTASGAAVVWGPFGRRLDERVRVAEDTRIGGRYVETHCPGMPENR